MERVDGEQTPLLPSIREDTLDGERQHRGHAAQDAVTVT